MSYSLFKNWSFKTSDCNNLAYATFIPTNKVYIRYLKYYSPYENTLYENRLHNNRGTFIENGMGILCGNNSMHIVISDIIFHHRYTHDSVPDLIDCTDEDTSDSLPDLMPDSSYDDSMLDLITNSSDEDTYDSVPDLVDCTDEDAHEFMHDLMAESSDIIHYMDTDTMDDILFFRNVLQLQFGNIASIVIDDGKTTLYHNDIAQPFNNQNIKYIFPQLTNVTTLHIKNTSMKDLTLFKHMPITHLTLVNNPLMKCSSIVTKFALKFLLMDNRN